VNLFKTTPEYLWAVAHFADDSIRHLVFALAAAKVNADVDGEMNALERLYVTLCLEGGGA
jgi:hypothetical protein